MFSGTQRTNRDIEIDITTYKNGDTKEQQCLRNRDQPDVTRFPQICALDR